jgi:hypothetical protein
MNSTRLRALGSGSHVASRRASALGARLLRYLRRGRALARRAPRLALDASTPALVRGQSERD